jgi:FkbM family methyltransferase
MEPPPKADRPDWARARAAREREGIPLVIADILERNRVLRQKVYALAGDSDLTHEPLPRGSIVDVVVTHNEINSCHGTGVLIERIFQDPGSIVALRATDTYGGRQDFGLAGFRLPRQGLSRTEIFSYALRWLGSVVVRRAVCIPFLSDEVVLALAVKELFQCPLCTYIMDDQNVSVGRLPDALMEELLAKSALRLFISPEMRNAYQNRYRQKMYLLPPVVSHELAVEAPVPDPGAGGQPRGILIGNIWAQDWLDLLRETVRGSGVAVDWYCNAIRPAWLQIDEEELARDGIAFHAGLPEAELAPVLARYLFAIHPSGTLAAGDGNRGTAEFSLPSRLPFIVAASQTPILVLGSARTAAARFVDRFGLGVNCAYDRSEFVQSVRQILEPERQARFRAVARRLGPAFSNRGIAEWLWRSMELGRPADERFEELMPVLPGTFLYYQPPPSPPGIHADFVPAYQALRRLRDLGFAPDFVVDVGASTGVWSHTANLLFPTARFTLVDPLASCYDAASTKVYIGSHPNFQMVEAALSDRPGRASFRVSTDLYNSSLLHIGAAAKQDRVVDAELTTLDLLAQRLRIAGRGLLKVDAQYAEHLILAGGRSFVARQVDAVLLELSLNRVHKDAKTYSEMLAWMAELGFRYFDDAGEWRDPSTGVLEQKDILFVRNGMLSRSPGDGQPEGVL